MRLAIWQFTKSATGLPSTSEDCSAWLDSVKMNLLKMLESIEMIDIPRMGQKIKRTGLSKDQLSLPLFHPQTTFPKIRQETIHQVKGESIGGVLVLGSAKFFNALVKAVESNENSEEQRLAYVAMTRARHVLLIGLPASHYDKYQTTWARWGFGVI